VPRLLKHLLDQVLPVDRAGNRATDVGVVRRRGLRVQREVAHARLHQQLELARPGRVGLDALGFCRGQAGDSQVPAFIQRQLRGQVGHDTELDPLDAHLLCIPVARVARQREMVARRLLGQQVRAVGQRAGRRRRPEERRGQEPGEECRGSFQRDDQGHVIHRADAHLCAVGQVASRIAAGIYDGRHIGQQVISRVAHLRREHAAHAVHVVLRGQRAAVGPGQAGAQGHGVDGPIG